MIQALPEWDKQIFYAINGGRSGLFDTLMPVFSYTWLLWALGIAAFFFWGWRAWRGSSPARRKEALKPVFFGMALILATAGITDLVTNEVKSDIGRLRPYQRLPHVHYQTRQGWTQNSAVFAPQKSRADSFFSGHAAHSMAVAVTAATLCPPLAPAVYLMPLVVGYSRVYLGKHYPSDVLCGWLAGASLALLARRITRRIRNRLRAAAGNPPEADQESELSSSLEAWPAKVPVAASRTCSPSSISQRT